MGSTAERRSAENEQDETHIHNIGVQEFKGLLPRAPISPSKHRPDRRAPGGSLNGPVVVLQFVLARQRLERRSGGEQLFQLGQIEPGP